MTDFHWTCWPTHFKTVFQKYGEDGRRFGIDYTQYGQAHHCGVDIKSGNFGEVMAVAGGQVTKIDYGRTGLGHHLIVKHNDRFETLYAHLSRILVEEEQPVCAGHVLAWSGWTGNTRGDEQHLHVGQIDRQNGDPGCYGKYVDPQPYYQHLLGPQSVGALREAPIYDIYSYMAGDGRSYRVRSNTGAQEAFRTEIKDGWTYQVKNAQWEQFRADDAGDSAGFIYRHIDTSPGGSRFYTHTTPACAERSRSKRRPGAPWCKRHMTLGESFRSTKRVQFFNKCDCSPSAANSGVVTDTIRLIAHLVVWTSDHGCTLRDVIRLLWVEGGETYTYAKNYGLVAWSSAGRSRCSSIVEECDERHEMEQLPCSM